MVVTQFDTPHVLLWVVVIRIAFVEAVATLPDVFPVVEFVDGPGLFGLVVDTELDATGGAEQVGLTFAVSGRLQRPLDFLDAGNVTGSACAAVHTGDQIGGRLPSLQVKREVNGALVALNVGQHVAGVVVQALLQALGAELIDGMRRHLYFQVGTDVLDFGVEVFDQQDDAKVCVLQLVLIARVLADTTRVPTLASEIDDGPRLLEQAHDFRADQSAIELADCIDAAGQDFGLRQIDDFSSTRINENSSKAVVLTVEV